MQSLRLVLSISFLAALALSCGGAEAPIQEGGPPAEDVPPLAADQRGVDAAPVDVLADRVGPADVVEDRGAGDVPGPGPDTTPGDDVQWPPQCCDTDADCPDGKPCVGAGDGVQGQCRVGGLCYEPGDCPEHYACVGATVCSCEDDCLSMSGHCAPLDGGCCGGPLGVECPSGTQCVPETEDGVGTCAPVPDKEDHCWSDGDCPPGQVCDGAQLCPCDADCDMWNSFGHCQDSAWVECIEKHSGCGCEEGCADGFWAAAYYPQGAGPFPPDFWPSQDLLDAAVAWYGCSICTCEEDWHVKVDGVWNDEVEGGVEAFCLFLLEYQEACGQCLEVWEGGCC
jgi:hypothetical protein